MIIPLPALVAYRKDATHLGESADVDARLSRWLAFAATLEQVVSEACDASTEAAKGLTGALHRRGALLRSIGESESSAGDAVSLNSAVGVPLLISNLTGLTRRVADDAEQSGALWLAYAMLSSLERVCEALPALEHGRALAQSARVARKADAADVAEVLYKRVSALARTANEPELKARAAIGFGVLAQFRGNLPLAARHYATAARTAARVQHADLLRTAQHGQMVIAAKRGEFSDALTYGWAAFGAATGNREREAEMLLNLAQLALDTGHAGPALQGFAAALARRPGPRLTLPALGGAARAAAAVGRADIVEWCARRIGDESRLGGFAYPTASALLDLATAMARRQPSRSADFVRRALRLTEQFRFHELEHHLTTLRTELARQVMPDPLTQAVVTVGSRGDDILRQIEQLKGELLTEFSRS